MKIRTNDQSGAKPCDDLAVAVQTNTPLQDTEATIQPIGAILLPWCWNMEKDYKEILDRFGPEMALSGQHPLEFLHDSMLADYERFNGVLNGALYHYLALGPRHLIGFEPVLNVEEKIEWLLELVATYSKGAGYRRRFQEDLASCLFYERERCRIMRDWLRTAEPPFLYELVEIADGFAASGMKFEESLTCEDCGYDGDLYFHGTREDR